MRFVIIGPGALGCLFAASLSIDHQHEVWLLDHNRERAAQLNDKGLRLQNGNAETRCPIRATANVTEITDADCILLCVKSHQVPTAIAQNHDLFQTTPLTIAFQNGIGHLEPLTTLLPKGQWAVGITAQGANLIEPGRVRHGGHGLTSLGFFSPPLLIAEDNLQRIAAALTKAHIETSVEKDIRAKIWQKLLVNVGINALTAILNCANGELLHSDTSRQRLRRAVEEGAMVAKALGVNLAEEPVALTIKVCKDTNKNISSMLQDVRNHRRTEIDAINNAIVQQAHRLNIKVPENEALVREIKEFENGYLVESA